MEAIKLKKIENTPFSSVKNEKGEVCIILGNNLVSQKKFKTHKEAKEYVLTKPYEIIGALVYIIVKQIKNEEK